MKQNYAMTMSNLLSTNVVVSILVSVYSHKHSGLHIQYITWYIQHATHCIQKVPNGPFSHNWSHFSSRWLRPIRQI